MRSRIRTDHAGIVIGNHQSVLDAPVFFLMFSPWLARFVARARYLRVPVVGGSIRLADCPVVDPRRDRLGAVDLLRRVAEANELHAVAIFPEGHRSRDGEVLPFRTAGCIALLSGRAVPVITVAVDGAWHVSHLTDVAFRLHTVRMQAEVIDEAVSPLDPEALPEFLEARRQMIVDTLRRWRTPS
jgi:1-acyl-sn-glycerol-3-phosphate acyltransferase